MKKVSVIIPVYNGEKYIKQCIESVINQTYKNLEIIIVNDGSLDHTEKEINKVKDHRIKKISLNCNSGVSTTRNIGIDVATGDYITFLDSDDLFESNRVYNMISTIENEKDVDIIYTSGSVIDENNNILKILTAEEEFNNREDFLAYSLFRQFVPCPAAIFGTSEAIKSTKYPEDVPQAEDYKFIIELLDKYEFKYVDEPSYYYRRHYNNLTNNHIKQLECEKKVIKDMGIERIKEIVNNSYLELNEKRKLLANIMIKIGCFNNARDILMELPNENFSVIFTKGVVEFLLKNYDKALIFFEKCKIIDDNRAEIYNNIGCCLLKLNDNKNAEINFKIALSINNEYGDASINLKNLNRCKLTEKELRKVLTVYN